MIDKKNNLFLLILFFVYLSSGFYLIYHGYILLLPHLILGIFLFFVLLSSFFLLFTKKYKKIAFKFFSSILIIYTCIGILTLFSWDIRKFAFYRLASKSEFLISAIDSYGKNTGKTPLSLNDLVPDYISKIPKTGIIRYPEYTYNLNKERWSLSIDASLGVLNWDVFVYLSDQKYPDYMAGGSVERIGKWAYIHE